MLERTLDIFVVCRYETGLRVQYTQYECRQVIDCAVLLNKLTAVAILRLQNILCFDCDII
jgi:hypothetical protein